MALLSGHTSHRSAPGRLLHDEIAVRERAGPLVAARREAEGKSLDFEITNPSPAFMERVVGCGLAETLGFVTGKDHP